MLKATDQLVFPSFWKTWSTLPTNAKRIKKVPILALTILKDPGDIACFKYFDGLNRCTDSIPIPTYNHRTPDLFHNYQNSPRRCFSRMHGTPVNTGGWFCYYSKLSWKGLQCIDVTTHYIHYIMQCQGNNFSDDQRPIYQRRIPNEEVKRSHWPRIVQSIPSTFKMFASKLHHYHVAPFFPQKKNAAGNK